MFKQVKKIGFFKRFRRKKKERTAIIQNFNLLIALECAHCLDMPIEELEKSLSKNKDGLPICDRHCLLLCAQTKRRQLSYYLDNQPKKSNKK